MNKQVLKQKLTCPVNWSAIVDDEDFANWLRFLWYVTIKKHEVDGESSLLTHDEFLPCDISIEQHDETAGNILEFTDERYELASKEYIKFGERFTELRVAGQSDYSKHLMVKKAGDNEVAKASKKRGASVLLPNLTASRQMKLAWHALGDAFLQKHPDYLPWEAFFEPDMVEKSLNSMIGGEILKVYVDTVNAIGYTGGKKTPYCCLHFDFKNALVHIYPVPENKYRNAKYQAYVPEWDL